MGKTDSLRKRIYEFHEKNYKRGKSFTVKHFMDEGVARSTIYSIVQRCENGITPNQRKGQGLKAVKMPPSRVRLLASHFDNRSGRSTRKAARKYNISETYVRKVLSTKTSIKCRKKQKIPDRTELQADEAKKRCSVLTKKYQNFEWILDDESYFTLSHSSINGNDNYYSSDPASTPATVKFKKKSKFEPKLLVWLAMSRFGISKIFICPSGLAINQDIYREDCLKRRLIPFIKQYHSQGNFIFWPDLASSHYADTVIDFMIEENIQFVEKYENPANVPEVRPIEIFWALLKALVYEGGWHAKNLEELRKRILLCLKKIDKNMLKSLIEAMHRNLATVATSGVIERQ